MCQIIYAFTHIIHTFCLAEVGVSTQLDSAGTQYTSLLVPLRNNDNKLSDLKEVSVGVVGFSIPQESGTLSSL